MSTHQCHLSMPEIEHGYGPADSGQSINSLLYFTLMLGDLGGVEKVAVLSCSFQTLLRAELEELVAKLK